MGIRWSLCSSGWGGDPPCVAQQNGVLHLTISDDGVGGATLDAGSGLVGLTDRVEALGGTLAVHSPAGRGTTLRVNLPTSTRA